MINQNEFFGLIYGDGCLKNRVSFSNTNPFLVKEVCGEFAKLNETMKIRISTYHTEEEITDKEIINFWKNYLSGQVLFYKIRRRKSVQTKRVNRKTPPLEGVIEIAMFKRKLSSTYQKNMELIKVESLEEKEKAISFLRGLVAAEGSVKLHKNKLRELRIGSKTDQEYIRKLLKVVGIQPSKAIYDFYIAISGIKNFKVVKKLDLFGLHPNKKLMFTKGFINLNSSLNAL